MEKYARCYERGENESLLALPSRSLLPGRWTQVPIQNLHEMQKGLWSERVLHSVEIRGGHRSQEHFELSLDGRIISPGIEKQEMMLCSEEFARVKEQRQEK